MAADRRHHEQGGQGGVLLGQHGQRRQNEPGPVPAADEHDESGQEQHRRNRVELAEYG
jgi:hypothetical protein